jgi:hypothetical protein
MAKCWYWLFLWISPFFLSAAEHSDPTLLRSAYTYLHLVQSALGKPQGVQNTPDHDVEVADNLVFLNREETQAELAIRVVVDNPAKVKALATLVTQSKECGGVNVHVYVQDRKGKRIEPGIVPLTVPEAEQLFQDAFQGNWYFSGIKDGTKYVRFFVAVTPCVVQYYTDSLYSLTACGNRTSEDVFYELFQIEKIREAGLSMTVSTASLTIPNMARQASWRRKAARALKRAFRACSPFSACCT